MLYMAECSFSDPSAEPAWNEWYSGPRLDQLLTVPGWRTAQRFKAVTPAESPYLAIHSIDSMEIFSSAAYKAISGGGFKSWQQYIGNWKRNVFAGLAVAPEVQLDEYLILADGRSEQIAELGLDFDWLDVAGLDRSVTARGLARTDADRAETMRCQQPCPVSVYVAMIAQKRAIKR